MLQLLLQNSNTSVDFMPKSNDDPGPIKQGSLGKNCHAALSAELEN